MAKGELRGATAVVTGASSGIGEAIAWRLAREGLSVALVARRVERLEKLAARVEEAGGAALVVSADLTEEAERLRVFQYVQDKWGRIDVLVNNAGFGHYGYSADLPWPMARTMVEVNVAAVVHLTSLALSEMVQRGSGHIVNISSVAGSIPSQGVVLYCATKAFLDSFSDGLYRELQGSGVTVSSIRPGPVQGRSSTRTARRCVGWWPASARPPTSREPRLAPATEAAQDRIRACAAGRHSHHRANLRLADRPTGPVCCCDGRPRRVALRRIHARMTAHWGRGQAVRQRTLNPCTVGSNPDRPSLSLCVYRTHRAEHPVVANPLSRNCPRLSIHIPSARCYSPSASCEPSRSDHTDRGDGAGGDC